MYVYVVTLSASWLSQLSNYHLSSLISMYAMLSLNVISKTASFDHVIACVGCRHRRRRHRIASEGHSVAVGCRAERQMLFLLDPKGIPSCYEHCSLISRSSSCYRIFETLGLRQYATDPN